MDFIKKNKKWIILVGCIVIAIACFITFVKMSAYGVTESVKFNDLAEKFNKGNNGKCITSYVVLAAAIVSAILVLLKKEKFSLISSTAALVITFYDYFKVKDSFGTIPKSVNISYVAPWIVLLGFIIAVVPIILTFKDKTE